MCVSAVSETIQVFLGVRFYKCGAYFQHKGRRLHRAVWEHFNGDIPKGFAVHHKDHDKSNNQIENLVLKQGRDHAKYHAAVSDHSAWVDSMHRGAAKWHRSDAGREWHRANYQCVKEKLHAKVHVECLFCHVVVDGLPHQKYCSNKCKSAHRRALGLDNVKAECVVCGAVFTTSKFKPSRACSRACGAVLSGNIRRKSRPG